MFNPLRSLRKLASLSEPQTLEWSARDNRWVRVQCFSFAVLAIHSHSTTGNLALDDARAYQWDVELRPPQVEYDASFDLMMAAVNVVNALRPLHPPTTAGSIFVVDDRTSLLRTARSTSARVRPISHAGALSSTRPRGYDLFAMLLPILTPPAPTEFQQELLFPGELYPFQRHGVSWLFQRDAALLADDMGLGKTVQAITAIRALIRRGLALQALVICPKNLTTNWLHELTKWAPELLSVVVQGSPTQRRLSWTAYVGKSHVLLTTYETVRQDLSAISGRPFDVIVADEVQCIKNFNTTLSRAMRQIDGKRRWGLTGTPLENSIEDLAGVFGFIKPGLFSPMAARQMSPYTAKKLIEPFILRRRKQDVLRDLPPIVVNTVSLALSESQRRSYDMAERYGVAELQGTSDVTIQHVLALITRLKKICNFDPSTGDSSKVEYILEEFLPEACIDDQKAIIVSQYVETLNKLEEVARDYQPLKFHGQLSGRQRDSVLRTFSENHINRVLLLSLKAGGVGLNLTRANYLLHFDRWWNPAVEEQANARLHRIGQTRSVFVSRLICEDTIEERIDSILERKRSQFSQVFDSAS